MTPNNDGELIRLNIPSLTSDRCKLAEEGRVGIRNICRDAIEAVRKQEKNGELSEDESRDLQDKV